MQRKLKSAITNVFFWAFILSISFFISVIIIRICNLDYQKWVYLSIILLTATLLLIGGIQFIIRKTTIKSKVICSIIVALFVLISIPITFLFSFNLLFSNEHIVTKEGHKLVAYVDAFKYTNVRYYDYKNIFVHGRQLRLAENYGEGGFNPINDKDGYTYSVHSFTWYDDNGNPIDN